MAERIDSEHRLAVITDWGFFGAFAFCFVLSGFTRADLAAGLLGFALFIVAFIGHVILNWIFRTDFTAGEAALGFVVFVVAALSFIGSWLFDPKFGAINLAIGLVGFGAIVASVLFYLFTKYGMRGSFTLFDRIRDL
jgi:hypothetical protein